MNKSESESADLIMEIETVKKTRVVKKIERQRKNETTQNQALK